MQKLLNTIIIILLIAVIGVGIYLFYFDKIEVERIILDKDAVTLYVREKDKIVATVLPEKADDKTIIWTSSDSSIATINENGEINAISEGEIDITVSTKNKKVSATSHVKVLVREVKSIVLAETSMTLKVGDQRRLTAIISPSDATYPVIKFESSNNAIVTVDQNGYINAIGNGTADIIVRDTRGKVEVKCHITVGTNNVAVNSVSLDKTNARLKIGEKIELKATVNPSNASDKSLTWTSSNNNVVKVDKDGKVEAISGGTADIKATSKSGVSATCSIFVKTNPIVPSKTDYKYEGITMKYYVENKTNYYLSYIWLDDPYNQIKKLDSTTANYGKLMSDNELSEAGKSPVTKTLGQMLSSYISKEMIPTSKALIAYNASGFYVKGLWNPPTDYYHKRSDTWFVITDGKLIRNKDDGTGGSVIGIDANGNLQIYGNPNTSEARQQMVSKVINDKVLNTWSFSPPLINNGEVVYKGTTTSARRQGICQVDSNNYIMLTSTHSITIADEAIIFKDLNCKTAFNLDGGGSTSFFYKDANSASVKKIKCSDGSNGNTCRSIVEGIYFIEK